MRDKSGRNKIAKRLEETNKVKRWIYFVKRGQLWPKPLPLITLITLIYTDQESSIRSYVHQRTDDLRFFSGTQNSAQVQKHAAFFHARDNRRSVVAEPCGEFVGAERFSGYSQQESGQG